jgi:uncharacterized membrane protein SpoIIM required for sporulation
MKTEADHWRLLSLALNVATIVLLVLLITVARMNGSDLSAFKRQLDKHIAESHEQNQNQRHQTAGGAPGL